MTVTLGLILASILLGVGLAVDAFSVSIVNGLNEPHMRKRKACLIASTFGVFQFLMPMAGWFCVHSLAQAFRTFQKAVPWIALILLLFIGGKMLQEGILENRARKADAASEPMLNAVAEQAGGADEVRKAAGTPVGLGTLIVQGIATSIDALSVGFAFASYDASAAFLCSVIIMAVTFSICIGGLVAGRIIGTRLSGKAGILGGVILIFIGLEIFVRGVFF
ncbi:MAG: manganese efflux pump [Bacillota bacterium]|nr:manganese efflux pump [Bacillota bacterium]